MAWKKGKPRAESTLKKMRKLDDEQRKEAIRLYLSGLSTREVGEHFNCGDEAIRRILIEEEIPRRGRSEAVKMGLDNPETRKKMSDSHKGKKLPPRSEETKQRTSEARKKNWENPEYREKVTKAIKKYADENPNPFAGKTHSEETKAKISAKAKKRFENPEYKERVTNAINEARKKPTWKQKQSIARKELWQTEEYKQKAMAGLSSKGPTSLEKIVWGYLEMLEVEFEFQKVIDRAIADFHVNGTNTEPKPVNSWL